MNKSIVYKSRQVADSIIFTQSRTTSHDVSRVYESSWHRSRSQSTDHNKRRRADRTTRFLRESEKKLKRAQRKLSRKLKGSGKRKKAKKRVAIVDRKIARQRDDFAHKLSRNLVENHDLITFEDLSIGGMIRNHHLARSMGDAAWNRIVQYTMYKAESAGAFTVMSMLQ